MSDYVATVALEDAAALPEDALQAAEFKVFETPAPVRAVYDAEHAALSPVVFMFMQAGWPVMTMKAYVPKEMGHSLEPIKAVLASALDTARAEHVSEVVLLVYPNNVDSMAMAMAAAADMGFKVLTTASAFMKLDDTLRHSVSGTPRTRCLSVQEYPLSQVVLDRALRTKLEYLLHSPLLCHGYADMEHGWLWTMFRQNCMAVSVGSAFARGMSLWLLTDGAAVTPADVCAGAITRDARPIVHIDYLCSQRPSAGYVLFTEICAAAKGRGFLQIHLTPANAALRAHYMSKFGMEVMRDKPYNLMRRL